MGGPDAPWRNHLFFSTPATFLLADTVVPFMGGEIRGQLAAVPEPRAFFALAGCLIVLGVMRRFRKQMN